MSPRFPCRRRLEDESRILTAAMQQSFPERRPAPLVGLDEPAFGGNWISSTDCKQTLANDSFELFSATLRFCGWPFRSTENTRRNVPMLTKSRCLLT